MIAEQLKKAVLQAAIQGKLTEQLPEDGDARNLLKEIRAEKARLVKAGKVKKEKPLPEISEDEIPFDIPESWVWARLGVIGSIVGGGTPRTDNIAYWENGSIPWLTPADMKFIDGKYVGRGSRFISFEGLSNSSAQLLPKGSVVFSSRAPIGYVAITNNELCTNQGFKSIVPYMPGFSDFIYYFLLGNTNEIEKLGSGTTFKEVSGGVVAKILIPIPPLAEQQRIVELLEEVLPEIDKLALDEKKLDELEKAFPKKVKDAILQYAIQGKLTDQRPEDGDARDLLKEIRAEKSRLVKAGKLKKENPLPEITEDEIPFDIPDNWRWVRLAEITTITMGQSPDGNTVGRQEGLEFHQGKISFTDRLIGDSGFRCSEPKKIAPADSILLCVRAPVGEINITDRMICVGRGLAVVKGIFLDSKAYLYYYLLTQKKYFTDRSSGSTFKAINQDVIRDSLVALPPLSEQQRIVECLEELLPLCDALE